MSLTYHVEHKDGPKAKWKPFISRKMHTTLVSAMAEARGLDQDGYIDGTMRIVETDGETRTVIARDRYNLPEDIAEWERNTYGN